MPLNRKGFFFLENPKRSEIRITCLMHWTKKSGFIADFYCFLADIHDFPQIFLLSRENRTISREIFIKSAETIRFLRAMTNFRGEISFLAETSVDSQNDQIFLAEIVSSSYKVKQLIIKGGNKMSITGLK